MSTVAASESVVRELGSIVGEANVTSSRNRDSPLMV